MPPAAPKKSRGSWRRVAADPHGPLGKVYSTWKCDGCGFRAVTVEGENSSPGACMNRKCQLYGGD